MKFLLLSLVLALKTAAVAQSLTVMTYNLRLDVASDGEDAWPNRRLAVMRFLGGVGPDLLGVQEALPHQVTDLDSALTAYDYVGIGRRGDDGDEHSAIFYRRDRLEPLSSSTFWLSPTPDEVSVAWGANLPRIATYAIFRERETGTELLVVNTHLDHESEESRRRGLALIVETVERLVTPETPVLLMGDFNAEPGSTDLLPLKGGYTDAYVAADRDRRGPQATYVGFTGAEAKKKRRVDYIFLRRGTGVVVEALATLNNERNGRFPSDHLPVLAKVRLMGVVDGTDPDPFDEDIYYADGEYGANWLERNTFGLAVSYARINRVGAFAFGPGFSTRVSKHFAVAGGIAVVRTLGLSEANITGLSLGAAARLYPAAGKASELFVDIGPTLAMAAGERELSLGLAPGLSVTGEGGRTRVLLSPGGMSYARGRTRDPDVVFALAPTLGFDWLIGRRPAR